jgi:hypothetical protein
VRCSIMQPTFFPWSGYFRLMSQVDQFVFLDDVQLARQSWQTRNRVLVNHRVQWIVAPIRHVGVNQTIVDTELDEKSPWREKLGRLLRQAYARHPCASDLTDIFMLLEERKHVRLGDLNIAVINHCAGRLGIATPYYRSGEMQLNASQRTQRLIEISQQLRCDTYVSPMGSSDYLETDGFTQRCDIKLEFAWYEPPPYPQRGTTSFVSHLSIIDVVANLGWSGAEQYIRGPWLHSEGVK